MVGNVAEVVQDSLSDAAGVTLATYPTTESNVSENVGELLVTVVLQWQAFAESSDPDVVSAANMALHTLSIGVRAQWGDWLAESLGLY